MLCTDGLWLGAPACYELCLWEMLSMLMDCGCGLGCILMNCGCGLCCILMGCVVCYDFPMLIYCGFVQIIVCW